jgi:hypothetical protein
LETCLLRCLREITPQDLLGKQQIDEVEELEAAILPHGDFGSIQHHQNTWTFKMVSLRLVQPLNDQGNSVHIKPPIRFDFMDAQCPPAIPPRKSWIRDRRRRPSPSEQELADSSDEPETVAIAKRQLGLFPAMLP